MKFKTFMSNCWYDSNIIFDKSVCLWVSGFTQDWLHQAMCFYPPDIMTDHRLPPHLTKQLDDNGMMLVLVRVGSNEVLSYISSS